jgi:transposase InsO family protein
MGAQVFVDGVETARAAVDEKARHRARGRRRFRVMTTDSRHHLPVAPNLLDRKFDVAAPNRAWVGDFTYVATEQGWFYVAVVIDLFPPHRRKPGHPSDVGLV